MIEGPQIDWTHPINWQHPLNRGLVAKWMVTPHGKGGTTFRDLTGRHHGTLTGMDPATDWVNRDEGFGALDFDGGNDEVAVGNPTALQLEDGPISISAWVYSTTGGDSFITKGESRAATNLRSYDLFDTGSQFRFHGLSGGGIAFAVDTTIRPALNTWHLIVGSWDGTTDANGAKLYIDGQLAGSDTSSQASMNLGHNWYIGGHASAQWAGKLDDIRIWNRALSAAEVAEYYELSQQFYPGILRRVAVPFYSQADVAPVRRPRGLINDSPIDRGLINAGLVA